MVVCDEGYGGVFFEELCGCGDLMNFEVKFLCDVEDVIGIG